MRKLITKFMLTTLGLHWEESTLPEDVKKSIRTEKRKDSNLLYEVDFIQLANFLFTGYSDAPVTQLLTKIEKTSAISELKLDELKRFVPRSNWERYFSPIVDCESGYLEKRWRQLYELRCKVAHNKNFDLRDFESLQKLVMEVSPKLVNALANLEQIHVAKEDREILAENLAGNLSSAYGDFLISWKKLVDFLGELVFITSPGKAFELEYYKYRYNVTALVNTLRKAKILDKDTCQRIDEFRQYRNAIVHRTDVVYSEEDVRSVATRIEDEIMEIVSSLSDSILMDLASNTSEEIIADDSGT